MVQNSKSYEFNRKNDIKNTFLLINHQNLDKNLSIHFKLKIVNYAIWEQKS